jgi:hypothetical protein
MMMEAASTSETLVIFYQTTRRNNPKDSHLYTRRRENLKSHILYFIRFKETVTPTSILYSTYNNQCSTTVTFFKFVLKMLFPVLEQLCVSFAGISTIEIHYFIFPTFTSNQTCACYNPMNNTFIVCVILQGIHYFYFRLYVVFSMIVY